MRQNSGDWLLMRTLLALALLAAPAAAQEVQQTPEGAHRFLGLVPQQVRVTALPHRFVYPAAGIQYAIGSIREDGPCASIIEGKADAYAVRGYWTYDSNRGFDARVPPRLAQQYNMLVPPYRIDWGSVSSIMLGDYAVANPTGTSDAVGQIMLIHAGGTMVQLRIFDAVMAKRVQYAMQFLKESCDATAETGF
jgi:hypothetical protein